MRTIAIAFATQVACSQIKDHDTALVDSGSDIQDTAESEPSSEETDTSETTELTEGVVVNEICVDDSQTEDWIELYNGTDSDIDVSGWTIGDDETDMVLIDDLLTDTLVPAGGFVQVFTKVELEDGTEIGFGLKKDGSESLFVQMGDSLWTVEAPSNNDVSDTSYARIPDGGDTWQNGVVPTPGGSNQ